MPTPFSPASDPAALREQALLVLRHLGARPARGGRVYEDDRLRLEMRCEAPAAAGLTVTWCEPAGDGIRARWRAGERALPEGLGDGWAEHLAGLAERAADLAEIAGGEELDWLDEEARLEAYAGLDDLPPPFPG